MSRVIHKLALNILGAMDSSFITSVNDTVKHVNNLEDAVKNITISEEGKADPFVDKYIEMGKEAEKLSAELADLSAQQGNIDGYIKQRESTARTANEYRNTKKELKELSAAYEADRAGMTESRTAMKTAAVEAKKLEQAY